MVKVVERGPFRVYVYVERGQRHHRAHCHILWGGQQASVALADLEVLRGPALPRQARDLLVDYSDEIREAWRGMS